MVKFNLYLSKQQLNRLKALAQNGISVAEHIRRAIDEYLAKIGKENK